jgi:hypothetical protein
MRVLVVGGGGREHALVWRLGQSPVVERLVAAPGNAGIARDAACVPVAADDVPGILDLVDRERIDLTVIGPEVPLVAGLADELATRGRLVFGPARAAARIEGSKAWAKALCERHGIPAARSRTASSMPEALDALPELESLSTDVAMVCIGGDPFTMGPQEAGGLVKAMGPKVAVPMHYGFVVGSPSFADEFTREAAPVAVQVMKPTNPFEQS